MIRGTVLHITTEGEMMRTLIELFRVPSAKTLAQRQIEESERQWVKHLEASEYHQAMMRYHTDVVRQLKAREAA